MNNQWKWITILVIIAALTIMLSAVLFNWGNLVSFPGQHEFEANAPRAASHIENSEIPNYLSIPAGLITAFLGSAILMYLFPRRIRTIADRYPAHPRRLLNLLLGGFLSLLLLSAIGAGSALSIGTFPFLFLIILLQFWGAWMGYTALSYRLGSFVQKKTGWFSGSPLIALAGGHICLYALLQIPIFGIFVFILLISLGLGGILSTRFGSNQPWSLSVFKEGLE